MGFHKYYEQRVKWLRNIDFSHFLTTGSIIQRLKFSKIFISGKKIWNRVSIINCHKISGKGRILRLSLSNCLIFTDKWLLKYVHLVRIYRVNIKFNIFICHYSTNNVSSQIVLRSLKLPPQYSFNRGETSSALIQHFSMIQ